MEYSNTQLNKLVKKVVEHGKKNSPILFLTFYIPNAPHNLKKLQSQANSLVHSAVNKEKVNFNAYQKQEIIASVLGLISNLQSYPGIVIFLDINPQDKQNTVINTNYYLLNFKPLPGVTLAKTYNLIQILENENVSEKLLMLHLQREEAKIYSGNGRRLTLLDTVENPAVYKDAKQGKQVHSPTRQNSMHYFPPQKNIERSDREADFKFIKLVKEKLADRFSKNERPDKLIIFLSDKFRSLQGGISKNFYLQIPVELLNSNPDSKRNILDTLEMELAKKAGVRKFDLNKALALANKYEVDWYYVTRALRERNCQKLALPKLSNKTGYVLIEKDNIHTYPYAIRKSFITKNLKEWMALNAFQQNSEVHTWSETDPACLKRY